MNLEYVPIEQIDPNPWQVRLDENPEHVRMIGESIRENREKGKGTGGLLQLPMARRVNGRVQLAFGMTRFAAWKADSAEPFPVNLEELTDREMSDKAAEENARRKNLTPIEIAKAILRRVQEFDLTQIEAAKPFGYDNQATIANIVGMLKLPQAVQDMVQGGKLAQRNARMLRVIERLAPEATQAIAEKSLSMDNAEEYIDRQIEGLLEKKGCSLADVPWKFDWAPTPMEIGEKFPDLHGPANGFKEIPACRGCPYFFVRRRYGDTDAYCGRAECFDAKLQISIPDVLAKASRKLGIAVAAEGEQLTALVWAGNKEDRSDYGTIDRILRALRAKRPELRLIPFPKYMNDGRYDRAQYLGSRWITLGTVDKASLEKWMNMSTEKRNEQAKMERGETLREETEAQRSKRIAEEEKEARARRKERAEDNKNKHEVLWLVENTARLVAERLELSGGFTTFVEELFVGKFNVHAGALAEHSEALEERIAAEDKKKNLSQAELFRKEQIAFVVLAQDVNEHYNSDEGVHYKSLSQVHKQIEHQLGAGKRDLDRGWGDFIGGFGVKLPQSWDKVPILRTAFNCWECGVFAPGEKLTQRDKEEGWFSEEANGKPIMVRCPEDAPRSAAVKTEKSHNVKMTRRKEGKTK